MGLQNRFKEHFNQLRKREKTSYIGRGERDFSIWQKDFDKYGEDSFEFYLIEDDIPENKHLEREAFWIHEYKSNDPQYGYNIHVRKRVTEFKCLTELPPKSFED